MGELKMPELNSVILAGNLTRDPVYKITSNNTPIVNFSIASNRRFKDGDNQWQEDVCFVSVVAWNTLARNCRERLKKGSAVLVDGELTSRIWKTDEGYIRNIVEIRARKIQFLSKQSKSSYHEEDGKIESVISDLDYEDNSFDKFLSNEESEILNNK